MCQVTLSLLLTRQYFLFKYISQFLCNSALSVPNGSFFSPHRKLFQSLINSSLGQKDDSFVCRAWCSLKLKVISWLLQHYAITCNRNCVCTHVASSCAAKAPQGGLSRNTKEPKPCLNCAVLTFFLPCFHHLCTSDKHPALVVTPQNCTYSHRLQRGICDCPRSRSSSVGMVLHRLEAIQARQYTAVDF